GRVVALDREHRLPRRDPVAVVEGADRQPARLVRAEPQDRDHLVHSAQPGLVLLEDLDDDARLTAVGEERRPGMVEVRVGVPARAHLLDGEVEDLGSEALLSVWRHARARGTPRAPPRPPRAARRWAPRSRSGDGARVPASPASALAGAQGAVSSSRRARLP